MGAGGAGSAITYALLNYGTRRLTIADVEKGKAAELVNRLRQEFPFTSLSVSPVGMVPSQLHRVDGIVNASPVGMVGHPGVPFDVSRLHPGHWVADVVYRPVDTELVKVARNAGCTVLNGGAMLVAQAAGTFELLTGVTPDLARMRRNLRALLAVPAPLATS